MSDAPRSADKSRSLGVVECFHVVIRQCPNGSVGKVAEHALAILERDGAAAMAEQAFLVLSAVRGWQGERAAQVKRSLESFLAKPVE